MRNFKFKFLILLLLLFAKNTFPQYQLSIKSNQSLDSIAYLRAVIFDDKNFIPKDTIHLIKGVNKIKYNKSIVGGIYYLYFPISKKKIYLTLEDNDKINFTINDTNYLNYNNTDNITNQKFLSYQSLAASLSSIDSLYDFQIKQGRKFNLTQKAAFFESKNKQLIIQRKEIMKTIKPTSALYLYFDALNKLDASIPNKKKYLERDKLANDIDINTPKLLFSPIIKQFLTEYLSYYPLQADSIVKGVDSIMHKVDCKGKAYPFVFDQISKILNNREIQNNTDAFIYFINKYVKESKCKSLDPKLEKQLLETLDKLNKLKILDTSININLKDSSGNDQQLFDFSKKFDFTLITFFDPSCEHCKVELPKMDSTIAVLEHQLVINIGKYTICNDMVTQPEIWKKFINENHLDHNYVHVSLGNNNEIRKAYDAYTNPLFYLIDKDGKFISKKLSINNLRKILTNYIQNVK
jgi:hypothetical protein